MFGCPLEESTGFGMRMDGWRGEERREREKKTRNSAL